MFHCCCCLSADSYAQRRICLMLWHLRFFVAMTIDDCWLTVARINAYRTSTECKLIDSKQKEFYFFKLTFPFNQMKTKTNHNVSMCARARPVLLVNRKTTVSSVVVSEKLYREITYDFEWIERANKKTVYYLFFIAVFMFNNNSSKIKLNS